jgi:hypothetical protein
VLLCDIAEDCRLWVIDGAEAGRNGLGTDRDWICWVRYSRWVLHDLVDVRLEFLKGGYTWENRRVIINDEDTVAYLAMTIEDQNTAPDVNRLGSTGR